MFTSEGLNVYNWGSTIVWMGYHYVDGISYGGAPGWITAQGNMVDVANGDYWNMGWYRASKHTTYDNNADGTMTATINNPVKVCKVATFPHQEKYPNKRFVTNLIETVDLFMLTMMLMLVLRLAQGYLMK